MERLFISKVGLSNVQIVHNIVPQPQKESLKVDGVLHGLFLGKICKEKEYMIYCER